MTARSDARDDGEDEGFDANRRKALVAAVLAVVLAAGAFALIGRFAHFHELLNGVRRADLRWLPVLFAGEVLAYAGYVLAYRDLARAHGGPALRYWTIVRVIAIGFGAFVLGSGAGTLAIDLWALRRAGVRTHEAIRRVLALNTLEWAWLAVAAAVAGAITLVFAHGAAPLWMSVGWVTIVPLCTVAALWVSGGDRGRRLARLPEDEPEACGGAVRRSGRWLIRKARLGFAEAVGGLLLVRLVLLHPRRYTAGFVGYPIYWLGDLVALYASLRAFGDSLSPSLLVLAYASAYVLTALPLPAGGAGGVDAALALSLHVVGVPLVAALLATALYRVVAFWLPIAPAVILLPTIPTLKGDLDRLADARSS